MALNAEAVRKLKAQLTAAQAQCVKVLEEKDRMEFKIGQITENLNKNMMSLKGEVADQRQRCFSTSSAFISISALSVPDCIILSTLLAESSLSPLTLDVSIRALQAEHECEDLKRMNQEINIDFNETQVCSSCAIFVLWSALAL